MRRSMTEQEVEIFLALFKVSDVFAESCKLSPAMLEYAKTGNNNLLVYIERGGN